VKREVREETGLAVTTVDFLAVSDRTFDGEHWVSILYRCGAEGDPTNAEPDKHRMIAWQDLDNLSPDITAPSRDAIDAFQSYRGHKGHS
jgi:ADP-ribose pyrophosphatase YjhB (NUDIX family)